MGGAALVGCAIVANEAGAATHLPHAAGGQSSCRKGQLGRLDAWLTISGGTSVVPTIEQEGSWSGARSLIVFPVSAAAVRWSSSGDTLETTAAS